MASPRVSARRFTVVFAVARGGDFAAACARASARAPFVRRAPVGAEPSRGFFGCVGVPGDRAIA
ncbi:Hypothetical protein A7982_09603 [Minicystis rosea]|nr:Hypothetical protein A7982_09603 [Minicystis rosea]